MDDYTGPAIYSSAVAVAILCGLAVFLDIPPFIWHARNHNFAAASLVLWVILINLMYFVNAIIWPNDDVATWFSGIILCDIEIKLQVGSWVAIVGSLACIMRNLARVMDTEAGIFVPTKAQRIRQRAVDITLCFGFPVLIIALSCIPQYYRYFLVGINGCVPAFDESWPTIAIIYIWPPILSLVDTYYAVLLVLRIQRYRRSFSQILSAAGTTKSRFMRLFVMSMLLVLVFVPVQFYVLYGDVRSTIGTTLAYFRAREYVSTIALVKSGGDALYDRWIAGASGILVFAFFGVGEDAMRMYRRWAINIGLGRFVPGLLLDGTRSSDRSSFDNSRRRLSFVGSKAQLFFSSASSSAQAHKAAPMQGLDRNYVASTNSQDEDSMSVMRCASEKVLDLTEMLNSTLPKAVVPKPRMGDVVIRKYIWQTESPV